MNFITDLVKEDGISKMIFDYEHQLKFTNVLKDLKRATRTRYTRMDFDHCNIYVGNDLDNEARLLVEIYEWSTFYPNDKIKNMTYIQKFVTTAEDGSYYFKTRVCSGAVTEACWNVGYYVIH